MHSSETHTSKKSSFSHSTGESAVKGPEDSDGAVQRLPVLRTPPMSVRELYGNVPEDAEDRKPQKSWLVKQL